MALHGMLGIFVLSVERVSAALNEVKQLSQNLVQRLGVVAYRPFFHSLLLCLHS